MNNPRKLISSLSLCVALLIALVGCSDDKPKTPAEIRASQVQQGFSAWDGSHRQLERWIKKNLKDPDSYEHIETSYIDKGGNELVVLTKYRARNGFGGMTIGQTAARANIDGSLIEVLASE